MVSPCGPYLLADDLLALVYLVLGGGVEQARRRALKRTLAFRLGPRGSHFSLHHISELWPALSHVAASRVAATDWGEPPLGRILDSGGRKRKERERAF